MAIRSNRKAVEAETSRTLGRKNAAAAITLQNNIRKSIRDKGLIDTGRYIGSIASDSDETGAVAGTNVKTYPFILEFGSRYIRPYHPMRDGAMNSIPDFRRIYGGN